MTEAQKITIGESVSGAAAPSEVNLVVWSLSLKAGVNRTAGSGHLDCRRTRSVAP